MGVLKLQIAILKLRMAILKLQLVVLTFPIDTFSNIFIVQGMRVLVGLCQLCAQSFATWRPMSFMGST
jgi:hypothetical protein